MGLVPHVRQMDDWYEAMISQHMGLCLQILRPYIVKEELKVPTPAGGNAFTIKIEGSCGSKELAVTADMTIWELKMLIIGQMQGWAATSTLQLKSVHHSSPSSIWTWIHLRLSAGFQPSLMLCLVCPAAGRPHGRRPSVARLSWDP